LANFAHFGKVHLAKKLKSFIRASLSKLFCEFFSPPIKIVTTTTIFVDRIIKYTYLFYKKLVYKKNLFQNRHNFKHVNAGNAGVSYLLVSITTINFRSLFIY